MTDAFDPLAEPTTKYHRECTECNYEDIGLAVVEECPGCGARTVFITDPVAGQGV